MAVQANQESGKAKSPSKSLFIVASVLIVITICGLVALLVFYGFARYGFAQLSFGPQMQIILEPDYSLVSAVNPADLEMDAEILTSRANALGTRIKFVVAENNQIIAQVPKSKFSQNLIEQIIQIGLLEFVDFGETSIEPGTIIATDFNYKYFPQAEGRKWHTEITNAEFESIYVLKDKHGNYEITFELTPDGTKIFSDYTTKNVGHFLGIVKDKVVISTPMVNSPITSGSGVIAGNFTLEQAKSLAVYLRVRGPLPIPLKVLRVSDFGK